MMTVMLHCCKARKTSSPWRSARYKSPAEGGVVSAGIAMAGILLSCNRSRLAEFGGDVELNRQWAYSLLKRMKFVKRKATTTESKHSIADFTRLKQQFFY